MTMPERRDEAKAEDKQFLSKSHSARVNMTAPFRNVFLKWNSLILDTWMWEIVSMTFSTLCFLAIIGVLRFYDQKELPSFPQGLTLNTIMSILATGSKSALLCMIGTSIGQLKWLWFSEEKKRPLYDLQSFDDASRGPWGSTMVLMRWPHKGHFLISLGAMITIASIAFDPFTQQILRFPVRQVPSDSNNATVKQAILPQIPMDNIDEAMFSVMDAGIYSATSELDPVCPSGNCTWLPFRSAGWCSKCEDVTSQASLIGCDITSLNSSRHEDQTVPCNISFPDGSWINSDMQAVWNETILAQGLLIPTAQVSRVKDQEMGPYLNQTILGVYSPLSAFVFVEWEGYTAPIEIIHSVQQLQNRINISHATECVISHCTRTYNVSVSGGVPSTQTSLPDFGEIFHPENYPGMDHDLQQQVEEPDKETSEKLTACWKPDQGGSVEVMLTAETWPLTSNLWNNGTKFAGCPVKDVMQYADLVGKLSSQYVYNRSQQVWHTADWGTPESGFSASLSSILRSDFALVIENVAASMTRYARNLSNQMAYGTVYETQTYISVDWAFLTLPAVLVSLGIVFLASTIMVNSRHTLSLWKSSVLPVIYHELKEEMDVDEFARVSSMERSAQEITVKLEVSDTGTRRLMV